MRGDGESESWGDGDSKSEDEVRQKVKVRVRKILWAEIKYLHFSHTSILGPQQIYR